MFTKSSRILVAAVLSVIPFAICNSASADFVTEVANIADFDDQEYTFNFSTIDTVLSIDSIVIEFSHDNVEQVQIFLEHTGGGPQYAFFTLVNGFGSGVGNRIGEIDGSFSDLNGLAELTFVESGASTTVRDSLSSPVMTGTYLAEEWENNFGNDGAPYDPTTWRLVVRDNSVANNDRGALGRLTVNFTTASNVPEPGSLMFLMAIACAGLAGRRRS